MELFRAPGRRAPRADLLGRLHPRHARAPGRRTARARPRSTRWPRASAPTSTARRSSCRRSCPATSRPTSTSAAAARSPSASTRAWTRWSTSIEREPARGYVPEWPWRPVAGLLRVLPLSVGPPPHLRAEAPRAAVRIVVAVADRARRCGRPARSGGEDGEQLLPLGADEGRVDDGAVPGHHRSAGQRVQPAEGRRPVGGLGVLERRGAPSSTRSPAKTTVASPAVSTSTTRSWSVCPRPRKRSTTSGRRRPARRVVDQAVGRVERGRRAPGRPPASSPAARSSATTAARCSSPVAAQVRGAAARAPDGRRPERGVAEAVVVVGVGVDHRPRMRGHRADGGDQVGRLAEVRAGVDDEAGAVAEDEPAVEVQLAVPADEHAVGDLLPAGAHQQIRIGRPRLSDRAVARRTPRRRRRAAAPTRPRRRRPARRPPARPRAPRQGVIDVHHRRSAPAAAPVPRAVALGSRTAASSARNASSGAPPDAVGRRVAQRVVERADGRHQVPRLRGQRLASDGPAGDRQAST